MQIKLRKEWRSDGCEIYYFDGNKKIFGKAVKRVRNGDEILKDVNG